MRLQAILFIDIKLLDNRTSRSFFTFCRIYAHLTSLKYHYLIYNANGFKYIRVIKIALLWTIIRDSKKKH